MRHELRCFAGVLVLVASSACGLINGLTGDGASDDLCVDECVEGRVCSSSDECRLAVIEVQCSSSEDCADFEVCADLSAGAFCVASFDDEVGCPAETTSVETTDGEVVEVCLDPISTSECFEGFCS